MALHTDTEIYQSTYDLSKLVTQLVANMPRNFKADFGAELRRRCMTLVMRTYEANTSVDKAAILQRMRMEVETVNLSLRLAVDLRLISVSQYSRAIAITDSIGKQATGWQRHSERAHAAGPSRQSGQSALESGRAAGPQAHRKAQQGYLCIDCGAVFSAADHFATPAAAAPVVLPEPDDSEFEQPLQIQPIGVMGGGNVREVLWNCTFMPEPGTNLYTEQQVRALLAGVSAPAALAVERGEVLVTVSGFTGSGKSAIAGEIEIMCRALGLQVEWPDSDSEKHMTHADWIAALEQYKPRVRIVECNVPHSVVKGQDK